jgi:hypothetical protein
MSKISSSKNIVPEKKIVSALFFNTWRMSGRTSTMAITGLTMT